MKKISVIFGVILLIAAVSTNVQAYREYRGMEAGYGYDSGLDDQMVAKLKLTSEQTPRIKNLREAYIKEIQPLKNELDSKRSELKLLWLQQSPDMSKIKVTEREIRSLRAQIRDKINSNRLAVFKILTLDQRTKLHAYNTEGDYSSKKGESGQKARHRF